MKKDKELELIRSLVREEFMRGVPDFVIRQATDDYINNLRELSLRHLQQRSQSASDRSNMTAEVDKSLNDLSEELHELVNDKLFRLVSKL